jgi:hypothetical protein
LRQGIVKLQSLGQKRKNKRYTCVRAPFDFGHYRPKMCDALGSFVRDSATNDEVSALHTLLSAGHCRAGEGKPYGSLTRLETHREIRKMLEGVLERAKFFFEFLDVAERHFDVPARDTDNKRRNARYAQH